MNLYDARILLVDDEPELLKMVQGMLKQEGFHDILTAKTAREAINVARQGVPHVFVLDVTLPDGDGFTLFQQLKEITKAPVLFLSARDEDAARLKGLGLGADDYITKPFLPKEFILRLQAVLRRTYPGVEKEPLIRLGDVAVDLGSGVISGNGKEKTLTAKEYAIMETLNENRGRIVTVDSLCMAIWKEDNIGYDNTLMVHMRRLREKIEQDPSHPKYLITVRGLGYRLQREAAT